MSLKKPVVINDNRNICQKCSKANTCAYYTKYQKMLDMFENTALDKSYILKLVCYIKKCNMYFPEKAETKKKTDV